MRPTIGEQLSQRPITDTGAYQAMKETAEDLFTGDFNGPKEAAELFLTIVQAGAQVIEMAVDRQVKELFSQ